jgi:uncharacterized membrane protein
MMGGHLSIFAAVEFQFPLGWLLAVPLLGAAAFSAWRQRRTGLSGIKVGCLAILRGVALAVALFLVMRPVWVAKQPPGAALRPVTVLVDRSESMSLEEGENTRYSEALQFLRDRLMPALSSANMPVMAMAFDEAAEVVDGPGLSKAVPKGRRTNLAGAIAQSFQSAPQTPLAVISLTDGIANESADNVRALGELADAQVPFIGIGFGSDQGVRTLSLREIGAPPTVAPQAAFNISAHLEMMNADPMPDFDLLLFRDGKLHGRKTIRAGQGSRSWLESFSLTETDPGVRNYSVQLVPPDVAGLKAVNLQANASVRISNERELRVLYIQGALTWDYKFVVLALHEDNAIKLTGLTRTSKQSVFRQNVETAGEFLNGFPTSLDELADFRVVVLSNLRPIDLNPAQQEVLARFCGEMGGGLLMIGGPGTFDSSWVDSRLEKLLPVMFSQNPGVRGLDRPFRMQLSEEALQHPVFQITDRGSSREAWAQLPPFTQYGRVDAAKPGAEIWAVHQTDQGPRGPRILMAAQRYGAGLSAVLTIQNFWRWRLAKDADPQQFDRFWRQLFRFLSEAGRQDVSIQFADQDLRPGMDVEVVLEKQPNPRNLLDKNQNFVVRVEDSRKQVLREQKIELQPQKPVDFRFRAEQADVYHITVLDSLKAPIASRALEIRDTNVEFQNTARDMETLKQWASVSDGLAFKHEECPDAAALIQQIKSRIEKARLTAQIRRPVGVNGWMLSLILACLGSEWLLRKRWNLI